MAAVPVTPDPYTTAVFKFLVGPSEHEFRLHVGTVSRHSAPLSAMMRGPWKESQAMTIRLKDTDPDAFGRLSDFLYRGQYAGPNSRRDRTPADAADYPLTSAFPMPPTGFVDDFGRIMMAHGQVYVLGDKWDIPGLRWCALRQLREFLYRPSFCAPAAGVKGFIALVVYTFENTRSSPNEPLRSLVIEYAVHMAQDVVRENRFQEAVQDSADLSWAMTCALTAVKKK